jgi:MYXO-CTERM domain-containing protein
MQLCLAGACGLQRRSLRMPGGRCRRRGCDPRRPERQPRLAVRVEVDGCPNVVTDYHLPPSVRPTTLADDGGGGCAFAPPSTHGEVGGLGVGALTALLALRRRRARG